MARSRGRILLAVVFTLFGLNAWAQVFNATNGGGRDPTAHIILAQLNSLRHVLVAVAWFAALKALTSLYLARGRSRGPTPLPSPAAWRGSG